MNGTATRARRHAGTQDRMRAAASSRAGAAYCADMRRHHLTSAAAAALALNTVLAQAPPYAPASLPEARVIGHYENGIGSGSAASEGAVTQRLIANRPALRAAEVLEFVPGVIVTQHSGDGKANQYFLRGFNLDHGTDFATFVDGMPVNMVSHAHGQGYSDLNFLIPELVARIDYRKGPYRAADGDFSSAGSARFSLVDELPRGLAQFTLGEHRYRRVLLADSTALAGGSLLGAVEAHTHDGPWQLPQDLRRFNGWLRWSERSAARSRSLTLMAYDARWTATDQIPQRAVDSGRIDRFGFVDPTDGGRAQRLSLSGQWREVADGGEWRASAYAIGSRLNLFSNFTYFLDDPVDGDQFEQAERRRLVGGELARRIDFAWGGREQQLTLGVQARHDRLQPVGLYATAARQRRATTQESRVRQTQLGAFAELGTEWTPWLRSVAGLRVDGWRARVASSIAANGGSASDTLASPKLSLVFGPWAKTELFANAGRGFHSNDARGTVARVSPKAGTPVDAVPPLVKSRGAELGARTELVPGLQSSLALWRLDLDSELVFVGDAGDTEAARASRRRGIEWNNHWTLDALGAPGWLVDLDLAASRALPRHRAGRRPHSRRSGPRGLVRRDVGARKRALVRAVPAAPLRPARPGGRRLAALGRHHARVLAHRLAGVAARDPERRRVQPVRPPCQRHRLLLHLAAARRAARRRRRPALPSGRTAHAARDPERELALTARRRRGAAPAAVSAAVPVTAPP